MKNLLKQSWAIFWANKRVLLWTALIYMLVQVGFSVVNHFPSALNPSVNYSLVFIGWLVNTVIAAGFIQLALKLNAGETISLRDLFAIDLVKLAKFILLTIIMLAPLSLIGISFVWTLSGTISIVYWFVGVALFLIVYFYFISRVGLAYFVLIDKDTKVVEAFKVAWTISRGDVWLVVRAILVVIILSFLGGITVVGVLVSLPVCFIFLSLIYKKLMAKELPMIV